jgi:hypothetical protein
MDKTNAIGRVSFVRQLGRSILIICRAAFASTGLSACLRGVRACPVESKWQGRLNSSLKRKTLRAVRRRRPTLRAWPCGPILCGSGGESGECPDPLGRGGARRFRAPSPSVEARIAGSLRLRFRRANRPINRSTSFGSPSVLSGGAEVRHHPTSPHA